MSEKVRNCPKAYEKFNMNGLMTGLKVKTTSKNRANRARTAHRTDLIFPPRAHWRHRNDWTVIIRRKNALCPQEGRRRHEIKAEPLTRTGKKWAARTLITQERPQETTTRKLADGGEGESHGGYRRVPKPDTSTGFWLERRRQKDFVRGQREVIAGRRRDHVRIFCVGVFFGEKLKE